MELIDTHAHLDDEEFASDLDEVIRRAGEAGLSGILAVGTTLSSSRRAIALARQHAIVRAAVGIHPNYALEARPEDWDRITELSRDPEVVAVGETGLDRYRDDTPFEMQLDYFRRHLELAAERQIPVVIHCRDAQADVLGELALAGRRAALRGVMHAFSGQASTAQRCLELGLHISFAGQLTYRNRKFDALRALAQTVRADRLLVETDSPYLSPEPHRGGRNEPARVRHTAERLAELRGCVLDELAALTTANAKELFRFAAEERPPADQVV